MPHLSALHVICRPHPKAPTTLTTPTTLTSTMLRSTVGTPLRTTSVVVARVVADGAVVVAEVAVAVEEAAEGKHHLEAFGQEDLIKSVCM